MVDFKNIGRALRRLRRHRNMLQSELAFAAGVTAPMLSAYETGKQRPSFATIDKLLVALGCSAADLAVALQDDRELVLPRTAPAAHALRLGDGPAPKRGREHEFADVSAEEWMLLEVALPELLRLLRVLSTRRGPFLS